MIPYDDLVIALQTWRAKQGLPVAQMSGALTPPPAAEATRPPMQAFPPGISTPTPLPPPMATADEHLDVDDAALLDEHYEGEGGDFSMNFGGHDDSSTAIGQPPPAPIGRPSEMTMDEGGTEVASPGAKLRTTNRDDW